VAVLVRPRSRLATVAPKTPAELDSATPLPNEAFIVAQCGDNCLFTKALHRGPTISGA
jgi:hypothetical protein